MNEFHGQARFVSENYGQSALARRFGVTRYPAIFVDDVLVATPSDFGFYGTNEGEGGRYAPLKSAESHERFRNDLTRMIDLLLAGQADEARAVASPSEPGTLAELPPLALTDLDGRPVTRESLAGSAVLVEFWATWCPPCRGTLRWLGEVERRYGDDLTVVAIAIESDEAQVRKLTKELALPVTWVLGTPEVARAFGDISAVPTLFLFDRQGRLGGTFYGAPPTLHDQVESKLTAAIRS